jgi:hypothetical protein
MNSNQWVILKNNRYEWDGPSQIVKLKPHNTVKIKTALKTNILVHVKNLKPYHGSQNRNFSYNFQKQGGDANNFDYSEDKDGKFERSDMNSTKTMKTIRRTRTPWTRTRRMKNVE